MVKKCLILGGNSFIGSSLISYLKAYEFEVSSYARSIPLKKYKDVKYYQGDLCDDAYLSELLPKFDIIVHLITTLKPESSMLNPLQGYNIDVVQACKILETIKNTKTSVLFASSGGTVYGECVDGLIKEEYKIEPITHYGMIKFTIENLCIMYNRVYNMNNRVVRIANVYGPGGNYKNGPGIINALLRNAIDKEKTVIYGDGTAVKDYIHIYDLCEYLRRYIDYDGKEYILNIGTGIGTSISELIKVMEMLSENKLDIEYERYSKNDRRKFILDISKAKRELSYKPQYSIEDGLRACYLEALSEYKKDE